MPNPVRFQHAPWYIKAWRLRFYLTIPFRAVRMWWNRAPDDDLPFSFWWGLATGIAQMEMRWWYTSEEVFGVEE